MNLHSKTTVIIMLESGILGVSSISYTYKVTESVIGGMLNTRFGFRISKDEHLVSQK